MSIRWRTSCSSAASEGRQPFAPSELIAANGFDYVYYLQHNPDVAAAHVDPLQHFQTIGWKEGRDPNALFDTAGYLATYADVAAAGVNPLDHYHQFGWHEGRDPSVGFDTTAYLAANPDVAAAQSIRSRTSCSSASTRAARRRRTECGAKPGTVAGSSRPGRRLAARIVVRADALRALPQRVLQSVGRWCFFNRSPNASSASS